MVIKEAQGYSKEKAFAETGLETDVSKLRNATISWKNAGAPISGRALKEFAEGYIKEHKAYGLYLVVTPATDDTRTRPYSVINEVTRGKRKYKTFYQIKKADLKVTTSEETYEDEDGEEITEEVVIVVVSNKGPVEAKADKKDKAMAIMKELIRENRCDYTIEPVKEVVEGQKYAAHGVYTPSKQAEVGKFIFITEQ